MYKQVLGGYTRYYSAWKLQSLPVHFKSYIYIFIYILTFNSLIVIIQISNYCQYHENTKYNLKMYVQAEVMDIPYDTYEHDLSVLFQAQGFFFLQQCNSILVFAWTDTYLSLKFFLFYFLLITKFLLGLFSKVRDFENLHLPQKIPTPCQNWAM